MPFGSKLSLITFLAGILSHHAYFIHGEHLTNIPRLLLYAALTNTLGIYALSSYTESSLASASFAVSQLWATYLAGLWSSMLVYRAFFHRLRNIPGPFGARLSKFYHIYAIRGLDQYRWFADLHEKYGPVVRVGPSSVSIRDPEAIESVHGGRSKCTKSVMYDLGLPLTTLQQMRDKSMHERRRRTGGWDEAFSARSLRNYDTRLIKYATLLEDFLQSSLGQVVNLADQFSWYSFDLMADLTFGQSFGGLQAQKTHWAITSIRDSETALGLLGPIPWLIHLMTKLPNFMNPMHKLLLFSEESVEKRRQMEPAEPDIMSHLLYADPFFSDPTKEYQLLTGDARLLIIGGSDTTAMSLTFLFYHLATNPSLQDNLHAELVSHNLTSSSDITVAAVKDLPYLNALLNENLRLHPPVPSAPVRDTPASGLSLPSPSNISIPGDITVYTPLYSIQRSPLAFEKPDEFIPERWTTQPELIRNKKGFAPFLVGPQSCIGRQLAYSEMRTVVSKLVLRFKVKLAEGEDGMGLLRGSEDVFTVTIKPLRVLFEGRAGGG